MGRILGNAAPWDRTLGLGLCRWVRGGTIFSIGQPIDQNTMSSSYMPTPDLALEHRGEQTERFPSTWPCPLWEQRMPHWQGNSFSQETIGLSSAHWSVMSVILNNTESTKRQYLPGSSISKSPPLPTCQVNEVWLKLLKRWGRSPCTDMGKCHRQSRIRSYRTECRV